MRKSDQKFLKVSQCTLHSGNQPTFFVNTECSTYCVLVGSCDCEEVPRGEIE